jgi:hypothetical protein
MKAFFVKNHPNRIDSSIPSYTDNTKESSTAKSKKSKKYGENASFILKTYLFDFFHFAVHYTKCFCQNTRALTVLLIPTFFMLLASCEPLGGNLENEDAVNNAGDTAVTFTGLAADGSETATTTKLTLSFSRDIENLAAADIILDPGGTQTIKGALNKIGTGKYELGVGGITAGGTVNAAVSKTGYAVSGSPKTAQVYHYSASGATAVTFTGLSANGGDAVTTTKLTLTFDKDITGLAAGDITLDAGTTGADKGILTKTGTGTYELAVSGITAGGTVNAAVSKAGYTVSGNPKQAEAYYAAPAVFISLAADGSLTATTTKLTLTFSQDITGLTVGDIILNAASTGALKGNLIRTGAGTYDLAVNSVSVNGGVSVTVSRTGYAISGNPQQATVYYAVPVTFSTLAADGSATVPQPN